MTKLAIIDLDGVIADSTKRFEVAETKREFYRLHLGDCMPDALANPNNHAFVQKSFDDLLESLYWQTAFNPELVALDTLIEGAKEALETLRYKQGYSILFLTSRPETMRRATVRWLFRHSILFYTLTGIMGILMKAPSFQFTKTVTWKAGMVQTLCSLSGVTELLFIDDEESNRTAIADALLGTGIDSIVASSLAEALATLREE